jgi:alpha-acetolactate decarboxylase
MHMHFKTDDNNIAGHIDDLQLDNQLILKLPKQ